MTTRRITPDEFEDRLISIAMFNDVDWSKGNEKSMECFSLSLKVRGYAKKKKEH